MRVGVEHHLELAVAAILRLADEGQAVRLAADVDRFQRAADAVEIAVELHQPVGRRLHFLHQLVPGGAVGALAQGVEQERAVFGRRGGAGDRGDEKGEEDGEAHGGGGGHGAGPVRTL